jgi:hypothetical protein
MADRRGRSILFDIFETTARALEAVAVSDSSKKSARWEMFRPS